MLDADLQISFIHSQSRKGIDRSGPPAHGLLNEEPKMTSTKNLIPRGWSEEDVELVRAAMARGDSASSISRQMRGRTRNAILGIAYRNGWTKGRIETTSRFTRAAPLRRSMIGIQHARDGAAPITLAGPVWSHPVSHPEMARAAA
jgi:hypothetical protein